MTNNIEKKLQIHADICDNIKTVYQLKNADYGDSVGKLYSELGDVSFLTRISDKYYRLMNLLDPKKDKEVNFESVEDTIMDMANYCIIWMTERENARIETERKESQLVQSTMYSEY
ncbi:MAG: nucleotide modification associated domain-containing protein, partial [Sarcina sp.]